MGDGTKENPYTSADVYMRIAENGNTAKGLDLSGKYFEHGIDLHELDLTGAILNGARLTGAILKGAGLDCANLENANLSLSNLEGARIGGANLKWALLMHANLKGAYLFNAHLEKANLNITHLEGADLSLAYLSGANLSGAHLEGAKLWHTHLVGADLAVAHLEGAGLWGANLEGVSLWSAKFSSETELQNVKWGNYVLQEERNWHKGEKSLILGRAEDTYRRLKQWYTEHGLYDVAGKFFYREMEAKRKAQSWKKKPYLKLWSWVLRLLCGYGEKPLRVIVWAASVMVGLALIYFIIGSVWAWSAFWNSLYFSAVSFTALGYGNWVSEPMGWLKALGAFESFIGVFTIALFLITFVRKMTR